MVFEQPKDLKKRNGFMDSNPSSDSLEERKAPGTGKTGRSKTTKNPSREPNSKREDSSSSGAAPQMFLPHIEEHRSPSKIAKRELIELDAVQAEAH